MIEAALAHAARGRRGAPCLMLSWDASGPDVDRLLADPRVGSVGIKDTAPILLDDRYQSDPRVGRYFDHGDWSLPSPHETVYFIGPWRRLTPLMISRAMNAGVQRLRVKIGFTWVHVPTRSLRRFVKLVRLGYRLRGLSQKATYRFSNRAHKILGPILSKIRTVIAGPILRYFFLTADEACDILVKSAKPRDGHIPGRIVLVCGNLSPGGAERQVANTAIGLVEAKVTDVTLLAHYLHDGPEHFDFHLPRVLAAGVPAREIECAVTSIGDQSIPEVLRRVAKGLPPDLTSLCIDIANLAREFERLRPEVVHAWLDWDNVRAGLAAAIAGVPKIVLSGRNLNPSPLFALSVLHGSGLSGARHAAERDHPQ